MSSVQFLDRVLLGISSMLCLGRVQRSNHHRRHSPLVARISSSKAKIYVRGHCQRGSSCFIWLDTAKQDSSYNDQGCIAHWQTSLPLTFFYISLIWVEGVWVAMLAFPLGALSGIDRVSSVVFAEKRQESSGTAITFSKRAE